MGEMDGMGIFGGGDNVNDLLSVRSYVRQEENGSEMVHYFCPQKLSRLKYILLSATLNEEVYKAYFGAGLPVITYPEKKAAYKGRLKQFVYHSLGREDIKKKMGVFEFAGALLKDVPQIITFKMFGKQNDAGIHFGNSSGTNALQGKDIAIIGTPFKNQEAYKLVACYLGVDVNGAQDSQCKAF